MRDCRQKETIMDYGAGRETERSTAEGRTVEVMRGKKVRVDETT